MKSLSLFLASTLLIAAAPPKEPETKSDVRCFVALAYLGNSKDPNAKQIAMVGTLYYLGRLDSRWPALDIEAEVAAEASNISQADIRSLLVSCGRTIEQRGTYLATLGDALSKRGKAKP